MKEKIYTIPLTEALEAKSECLLCEIEEKVTCDVIKFYTGPAMMEPDTRIETNQNGFCAHHYSIMHKEGSKLSVALVLQTRLSEISALLKSASDAKKTRFSKVSHMEGIKRALDISFGGCTACTKIDKQMNNCYDNFVFLLDTEYDFRKSYFESNGLCMKHFMKVFPFLKDGELFEKMLSLQQQNLDRLKSEIDRFVLKFDYRNSDMAWDNAQDSPERAIIKLRGKY